MKGSRWAPRASTGLGDCQVEEWRQASWGGEPSGPLVRQQALAPAECGGKGVRQSSLGQNCHRAQVCFRQQGSSQKCPSLDTAGLFARHSLLSLDAPMLLTPDHADL